MNTRALLMALSCCVLGVLLTGCVPAATISTGVPASSADKFMFYMENEAESRGFEAHRDAANKRLSVYVDRGELDYSVQLDEIVVTLYPELPDEAPAAEFDAQIDSLRQLHEVMLDGAVRRAEKGRAFERVSPPPP